MKSLVSIFSHFIFGGILAFLANWVGLISWRRTTGAHWTERARLLWPARMTALMNIFVIPILLNEIHRFVRLDIEPHWLTTGLAGFFGVLLATFFFDREMYPHLHFRRWLFDVAANWSLRLGIWFALLAAIMLMPEEIGWGTLVVIVAYLIGHLALQWGLGLRFLQLVGFITVPSERLQRIVAETCARANLNPFPVLECGGVAGQAFAIVTIRKMLFSKRLLEICSDEEVLAVCAHELGHLSESKWVVAGRLVGSLSLFPLIFLTPVGHAAPIGIIAILLSPSIIVLFANRLSQRMEVRADSTASAQAANPAVYTNALEKIYRENQVPAVLPGKRQTHPHLYDRIIAAGITPEYERPRAPLRFTLMFWIFVASMVTFFVLGLNF